MDYPSTSTSTCTENIPITLSSKITIPESCKKTFSSKIGNLIEYQHIPEESQIDHSLPPLLSPYNVFRRDKSKFSWISSINKLISTPKKGCREYIQSSRMDQVALHSTSAEQYVDLEISKELIKQ